MDFLSGDELWYVSYEVLLSQFLSIEQGEERIIRFRSSCPDDIEQPIRQLRQEKVHFFR